MSRSRAWLTTFFNGLFPSFPLSRPLLLIVVTDVELKRLKDAFKRTSGLSYYMTQQCFYREVLGDSVPPKVAEVGRSEMICAQFSTLINSLWTKALLCNACTLHCTRGVTILQIHDSIWLSILRSQFNSIFDLNKWWNDNYLFLSCVCGAVILLIIESWLVKINRSLVLCPGNFKFLKRYATWYVWYHYIFLGMYRHMVKFK